MNIDQDVSDRMPFLFRLARLLERLHLECPPLHNSMPPCPQFGLIFALHPFSKDPFWSTFHLREPHRQETFRDIQHTHCIRFFCHYAPQPAAFLALRITTRRANRPRAATTSKQYAAVIATGPCVYLITSAASRLLRELPLRPLRDFNRLAAIGARI